MSNEKPSFYGIMPATIRYSKDINDFAKVLFVDITSLCNTNGYCTAKNPTLAQWHGKSESAISRTISMLEKAKFIVVDVQKNKSGTFRKIYPIVNSLTGQSDGYANMPNRLRTNAQGGYANMPNQKNNTSNNNTSNNINLSKEASSLEERESKSWREDENLSEHAKTYLQMCEDFSKNEKQDGEKEKSCAKKESDQQPRIKIKDSAIRSPWLRVLIKENDLKWLQRFEKSPKKEYIDKLIKDLGEEVAKDVLLKIESHCEKNPDYINQKKELSRVIGTFKKGMDSKNVTLMKRRVDEKYQKLFGEKYDWRPKHSKHLNEIFEKIKSRMQKDGNLVHDDDVLIGFSKFIERLPEYRTRADQFKIEFINTNLQQIILEIKSGYGKTKGDRSGDITRSYEDKDSVMESF